MKRMTSMITIALIAVLLLAVVSIRIFARRGDAAATAAPAVSAALPTPISVTPTPMAHVPEETPEATPSPTPVIVQHTQPTATPRPAATPKPATPTPRPTPPPTPTPVSVSASGSFSSATGTYLNLVVNWSAYTQNGARKLKVDLSASSYAFNTDALWNALELRVGNATYTANSPAVRYDGNSIHSTPLGTFTVDAPTGSTSVTAIWHYKGSYSGTELNDITASGTIYIP